MFIFLKLNRFDMLGFVEMLTEHILECYIHGFIHFNTNSYNNNALKSELF